MRIKRVEMHVGHFLFRNQVRLAAGVVAVMCWMPSLLLVWCAWREDQVQWNDLVSLILIPRFTFGVVQTACNIIGVVRSDWVKFDQAHAMYKRGEMMSSSQTQFPTHLQTNLINGMVQIGLQLGALAGLLAYCFGFGLLKPVMIDSLRYYVVWWCLYLVIGGIILGGTINYLLARLITSRFLWRL